MEVHNLEQLGGLARVDGYALLMYIVTLLCILSNGMFWGRGVVVRSAISVCKTVPT